MAISHRIDVKSYTSLHTLVNDMFPPTSLVEQEQVNKTKQSTFYTTDLQKGCGEEITELGFFFFF